MCSVERQLVCSHHVADSRRFFSWAHTARRDSVSRRNFAQSRVTINARQLNSTVVLVCSTGGPLPVQGTV